MSQTTVNRSRDQHSSGYLDRPRSSSLADVVELILDKGLVIDAFIRVSLVGIEVLTIDARIVIASVDTYLRFAAATNRLDLAQTGGRDLPELVHDMSDGGSDDDDGGGSSKAKGVIGGVKEALTGSDEDERKPQRNRSEQEREGQRSRPPQRRPASRPARKSQDTEEDSE
jgi:hypothetical protein